MGSVMPDRSDKTSEETDTPGDLAATFARARRLMIISALTTAIAIAAVVSVIGYRVFRRGESASGTIVNGTVFLPKGAHVDSTTLVGDHIAVTFDVNGTTQVRFFDARTLQLVGQLQFGTEH